MISFALKNGGLSRKHYFTEGNGQCQLKVNSLLDSYSLLVQLFLREGVSDPWGKLSNVVFFSVILLINIWWGCGYKLDMYCGWYFCELGLRLEVVSPWCTSSCVLAFPIVWFDTHF